MLLTDNNGSASLVEQNGFCGFIKAFFPHYQMPSAEVFCKDIIPKLSAQLRNDFISLQSELHCNK